MRWWDQRLSGPIYCRMAASFRILTQSAIGRDLCKMGDAGGTPAYSQAMPTLPSWACSSPECHFVPGHSGTPKDTLSMLLTSPFPLSIKILESWGTKISWPSVPTGSKVVLCPCLPRTEVLLETGDFWCRK